MSKLLFSTIFILTGLITLFAFQNCGVQKPGIENSEFMSTTYTHTGSESSCISCHKRPSDKTGFIGLNIFAPFDYQNHGAGFDCVSCHGDLKNANRTYSDWTKGYFIHPANQLTCTECHTTQRPLTITSGSAHPTTGECVSCHSGALTLVQAKPSSFLSSMDVFTMWKSVTSKPTFLVNDASTDVTASVSSATYNTAGVFLGWSTGSPNLQKLKMQMNHKAVIPGINMDSCSTCHTNSGDYLNGRFHKMVTTQSATCTDCHDDLNPNNTPKSFVASKTDAFVGPAAGINVTTNPTKFNHTVAASSADCSSCHAQSSWAAPTWKQGIFHKGNNTAPTSCAECHSPNRAVGLTSGGFDHATMGGMGDCIICHNAAIIAVKTKIAPLNGESVVGKLTVSDWKGASSTPSSFAGTKLLPIASIKFNMTGGVVTSKTASTPNYTLQIDHAPYQTNCVQCHSASTDMKMGIFHAAQTTQPTTCKNCHSSALDGFVLGYTGLKPLDHASTMVASKDCIRCHAAPTATTKGINFKDGVMHSILAAAPATCKECHAGKVLDQPVWGTKDHSTIGAADCLACHTALGTGGTVALPTWKGAQITPAGITGTKVLPIAAIKFNMTGGAITSKTASTPNYTLKIDHAPYQTNCVQCHSASTDMKMGIFHAAQTTQPTTCKNCHSSALDGFVLGYTGLKPLDHASTMVASKDCIRCHAAPTATTKGINFKDGVMHSILAAAPATCKECHAGKILDQPVWGTKNHSTIGAADCLACHTALGTGGTVALPTWKGASVAPVNFTIPAHTVGSSIPGFTATHTTNTNCTSCHGTSTTYKTITSFNHQGLPAGNDTCKSCHFGSSTQVSAYIASTSNMIAKGTDSRHHASSLFTSKNVSCVGCHTLSKGANTFATSSGIVFPTSAKAAYVNIGCGSVNSTTFSCHETGQRSMAIPTVPSSTPGGWDQ